VKPNNILVEEEDGRVRYRIADWDHSVKMRDAESGVPVAGTDQYEGPEVCSGGSSTSSGWARHFSMFARVSRRSSRTASCSKGHIGSPMVFGASSRTCCRMIRSEGPSLTNA
jgi:serine/threonine protein kinase